MSSSPDVDEPAAQRWQLVLRHRKMLADYIRCVVGSPAEAEDIFQEVGLVVQGHRTGPLDLPRAGAWLRGVARNVIFQHARTRKRETPLPDDDFLDLIDRVWEESDPVADVWDARRHVLSRCLQKLNRDDQVLLRQRFFEGHDSESIGEGAKRSPEAIRMKLMRLRQTLSKCIERQLAIGARR
jgi:RNA polymerase sigma-70 factor, ECF subfamily